LHRRAKGKFEGWTKSIEDTFVEAIPNTQCGSIQIIETKLPVTECRFEFQPRGFGKRHELRTGEEIAQDIEAK
jgi:hypothetical protein